MLGRGIGKTWGGGSKNGDESLTSKARALRKSNSSRCTCFASRPAGQRSVKEDDITSELHRQTTTNGGEMGGRGVVRIKIV